LVRLGAYQALDLTISEALNQRSPDFPGVVICTAGDSLGTLLQLIKKRRVHRLVVVEGEVSYGLSLVVHCQFFLGRGKEGREEGSSLWYHYPERRSTVSHWQCGYRGRSRIDRGNRGDFCGQSAVCREPILVRSGGSTV